MAVKIKLARYGKIREPFYRVVVSDSRTRRGGRAIETIGRYNPKADPSIIQIESERAKYWLGVGAQPTEAVVALLKVTGDWQSFKGLPGAEGTLREQPAKADKRALYEAAVHAAGGTTEDTSGATTAKKKSTKKAADEAPAKADKAEKVADEAPAEAEKAEKATKAEKAEKADDASAEAPAAAADETPKALVDAPTAADEASPFGEGSHGPIDGDAQPDGFPIKGNASSKLYHRPGTAFYDATVAEVWFTTEEAAEAAGFKLPPSQRDKKDV